MFLKTPSTKAALTKFYFFLEWYLNRIIQEIDLSPLSNGQPPRPAHPAWQAAAAREQLRGTRVPVLLVGWDVPSS